MTFLRNILIIFLPIALMASSCENESPKRIKSYTQEELLELNRKKVLNEADKIAYFIERSGWDMEESGSGLRYLIYYKSADSLKARKDMWAQLSYNLLLLDSTSVSSSEVTGLKAFRIDEGNVESGLHEAVKLMARGDSARLILPSHLAYGLTGSENIPSNAPLLYDICLVSLD